MLHPYGPRNRIHSMCGQTDPIGDRMHPSLISLASSWSPPVPLDPPCPHTSSHLRVQCPQRQQVLVPPPNAGPERGGGNYGPETYFPRGGGPGERIRQGGLRYTQGSHVAPVCKGPGACSYHALHSHQNPVSCYTSGSPMQRLKLIRALVCPLSPADMRMPGTKVPRHHPLNPTWTSINHNPTAYLCMRGSS